MSQILQTPKELDRLYKLRARLAGTDRDDHLEEINKWEKEIKKALIFLNLRGHEGIGMLIDRANEEIAQVDEILRSTRPVDLSPEGVTKYAYESARLFDRKELWEWFKTLFDGAESALKDAEVFLDGQEDEGIEKDNSFVGSERAVTERKNPGSKYLNDTDF